MSESPEPEMPPGFPYIPGNTIILRLPEGPREANIIRMQTSTLSCVMLVELKSSSLQDQYILKLYDRRFSAQVRSDQDAEDWDTNIEQKYEVSVRAGHVSRWFESWSTIYEESTYWQGILEDEREDDEWSDVQVEAYLQFFCQKTYEIETRAYDLLKDMQGKHVPKLFCSVMLEPSTSSNSGLVSGSPGDYLDCPGILLQYIRGFPLTDLAENAPREDWQRICEEAINIVHKVGDRGIINRDVKTRSFIVTDATSPNIQMFMMDFGFCRFRNQFKSEKDFRSCQADEDEEGAIAAVMEGILEKKSKGAFTWHRSERALKLLKDFKSEGALRC